MTMAVDGKSTRSLRSAQNQKVLDDLLQDLLREQCLLRLQDGAGKPGMSARIGSIRKDIARVRTIMHEKWGRNI